MSGDGEKTTAQPTLGPASLDDARGGLSQAASAPTPDRAAGWRSRTLIAGLGVAWLATWTLQSRGWRADPEAAYGWAVPLLALFLAGERWLTRPPAKPGRRAWLALLVLAFPAWLLSRSALELYSEWPAMLWLHMLASVAATVGVAGTLGGRRWARHFLFPALFTLTALPWPGVLHQPVVPALARLVATSAAGLADLGGVSARASGTLIEVSAGWLGVDEACSGIRSLQATVMAAIFLGEYIQVSTRRRWALVGCGIASAVVTNVGRATFLTWTAARTGIPAAEAWHDQAGYAVLIGNLSVLGALAWAWRARQRSDMVATPSTQPSSTPTSSRPGAPLAFGLILAVTTTELAPRAWSLARSATEFSSPAWTVSWPSDATPRDDLTSPAVRQQLRCTDIEARRWQNRDGHWRDAFYVRWDKTGDGRSAVAGHRPDICLPNTGAQLIAERPRQTLATPAGELRVRVLEFESPTGPFVVYHCVWPADAVNSTSAAFASSGFIGWWQQRCHDLIRGRPGNVLVLTVACWSERPEGVALARHLEEIRSLVRTTGEPGSP